MGAQVRQLGNSLVLLLMSGIASQQLKSNRYKFQSGGAVATE